MSETAIRTEGLRKVYRTGFLRRAFVGLHGLDLEIPRGEVFGLIGPNGAGKTTTLKLLMGLNSPTSGTAQILGEPIGSMRAMARVGFLPERPYFYDYLTATEFLHFYGQLHGMPRARRIDMIDRLLPLVHMERARDTQLRKFSKGMLQRVGIAQALMNDPELVVLDEPSSGLDPMGRLLIRDIVRDLKTKGTTVLFCSHVLSDVEEVSDRVGILIAGKLQDVGTVDELVGKRETTVEVTLHGLTDDLVAELPLQPHRVSSRGHHIFEAADHSAARALVAAAVERGGELFGYVARRESLEQHFMDEATSVERQDREAGVR
ncbi:MAG: ABC transporter ATP-binding protein [Deltaproteobacteria bacterium]|nr:ABC transporter ATP-binding protein [Deltaproteobacteria bacterium]